MTEKELNILSKIKVRSLEEQRDFLLEQNMLLTGKMATLEKENAELKFRIDDLAKMCNRANERHDNVADKLSKAKEIIKNLMAFAEMDDREYEEEYKQAEQFLSEVEK